MDVGGPRVRVVCVTTGAEDGDSDGDGDAATVANHWNARGIQAAFRRASICVEIKVRAPHAIDATSSP